MSKIVFCRRQSVINRPTILIILRFPYKIGYDTAGIVEEIGSSVSHLKVGDKVYTRLPEASRGKPAITNLLKVAYV